MIFDMDTFVDSRMSASSVGLMDKLIVLGGDTRLTASSSEILNISSNNWSPGRKRDFCCFVSSLDFDLHNSILGPKVMI